MRKDKSLFIWPPKMPSMRPKQKHQYKHTVVVASKALPREQLRELALRVLEEDKNAEKEFTELYLSFDLGFTSESKARVFKKTALESTSNPIVEYQRKELPVQNGEWIEQ
jgi:hypothetical protein